MPGVQRTQAGESPTRVVCLAALPARARGPWQWPPGQAWRSHRAAAPGSAVVAPNMAPTDTKRPLPGAGRGL
jgi:hypothetical protein